MSTNLENQIQDLLTQQKCHFCKKEVQELNLAGFEHQKDFFCFLKKPICQNCWDKKSNLIKTNHQNFSSFEQIKKTNQRLQSWIKTCKERQSFVREQKQNKNQSKNTSPKEERTIYEDWEKKLSD